MTYTCPKDPTHASTDSDYCSICGAKITGPSAISPPAMVASVSPVASVPATPGLSSVGEVCPDCGAKRVGGARFCEVCRYNFETGTVTAIPVAAPAPVETPPVAFVPQPVVDAVPTPPPPAPLTPQDALSLPPLDLPPVAAPNASVLTPDAALPDAMSMPTAMPMPAAMPDAAIPMPISAPDAALAKWEAVVTVDCSLYSEPDPQVPCPTEEPEKIFPLDFAENLIGRRSDKKDIHPEIPLQDPGVSHRHAKLLRGPDGGFILLDVGSTNGTQLNGVEIKPGVRTPVTVSDIITLGCWTQLALRRSSL